MLGWWLTLLTQESTNEQIHDKSTLIATWETGLGGLEWLSPLRAQGSALQLSHNGYPNSYRIQAGALKALFSQNPPPSRSGPSVWQQFYPERLNACRDDQWLWLEAWDQS